MTALYTLGDMDAMVCSEVDPLPANAFFPRPYAGLTEVWSIEAESNGYDLKNLLTGSRRARIRDIMFRLRRGTGATRKRSREGEGASLHD